MSGYLLGMPKFFAFGNNGVLLDGGKLYTYYPGTDTPKTTYSDLPCTVPNTNPIILDSRGEAGVYLNGATKLILTTPTGDPTSPIWTWPSAGLAGTFELTMNVLDFGADPTGVDDSQPAIQAAVDAAIAAGFKSVYLPTGTYKILDTIYLNYGTAYAGFTFRGDGIVGTTIDASSFGDRPAINIQGARGIYVEDMFISGKNLAPLTCSNYLDPLYLSSTKSNWITSGCVDSQHSPYAGIAVDSFYIGSDINSPTIPGDPYPSGQYDKTLTSSGITFKNVKIQGFVVGLCLAPWAATDQDCANIGLYDCEIRYNTYGYSCGSGQSRSIELYKTNIYGNWACITTITHGNKIGNCPGMFGGILQIAHKAFEIGSANGNNAKIINSVHFENFGYLGDFGALADSSSAPPTKFDGCHFTYPGDRYEPYFFVANSPIHFDGCFIDGYTTREILSYWSQHTVRWTSCSLKGFVNTIHGHIGISAAVIGDYATTMRQEFDSCEVENIGLADSAFNLCVNNELKDQSGNMGRRFISPWTHTVRSWSYSGFTNYKVGLFYRGYISTGLTITGPAISGTNHTATLTFTAGTAGDWKVGDIIMWRVPDRTGTWTTLVIPAFKVTVVAGTAITAVSMVDNVDVTYLPTTVYVVIPLFVNGNGSTGDTHSNTTVDNVTNITNWEIGDWIQGAGINDDTRITNISGTTITLSKAATATAVGVSLYNCKLTAY